MSRRLTLKKIAALRAPGRYTERTIPGLTLQITRDGVRSWLLRYMRQGRERYLGLGPLHSTDLETARERARMARRQLFDGIDPVEQRQAARAAAALEAARTTTFEAAAEAFHAQHSAKWRNAKHKAQFMTSLKTYAYPVLAPIAVQDIDVALVLKVLEPHWRDKTETASRVRSRVQMVLDYATARGLRQGSNPAAWAMLKHVLPAPGAIAKPEHHRALDWREVPAFLADLRKREGTAARALEFLALTASRSGEVLGAKWSEVDFENATWVVPAERMKAHKQHAVPLSDRALEILRSLPREVNNDHVFLGPAKDRGLSDMALLSLLRRMGRTDFVPHGMRASFKTWAAETTAYPPDVIEMALAHQVGNAVERSYARTTLFHKRAQLMDAWATHCCTTAPADTAGNVVAIRGQAAVE
jgi:integrase